MKAALLHVPLVLLAMKMFAVWKSIHTRQNSKPSIEVNMTISSVYDEYSRSFHLFSKSYVRMLLSPPHSACSAKHVVIIPSAPKNRGMRDKLRTQLGRKVFILFLLGRTGSEEGDRMLEEESEKEGDILQGDFQDSYRVLPYKVVMGYIWVSRFCSRQTAYVSKMDDDSIIDFDLLDSLLEKNTANTEEETISCPTVIRNQKPWRYSDAKVMGKWTHPFEELPDKFFPDYCQGFLYVTSPRVGLALAEVARILGDQLKPDKLEEDYIVSGWLAERLPWVRLRSLTPIGGDAWDNIFSHCSLLGLFRFSFNPIALGAGSADSPDLQYVNSPRFVLCVMAEFLVYEHLRPLGITWDIIWDGCKR
jgi:hypothetical protein